VLVDVDLGGARIASSSVGDRHSWYGRFSTDVFSAAFFA